MEIIAIKVKKNFFFEKEKKISFRHRDVFLKKKNKKMKRLKL